MLLGRVVGRLWAARQAETLGGRKLLLIRPDDAGTARDGGAPPANRLVVAVDGLDAGPGDRVIVAHGSRVRDLTVGETVADKDVVIAIVDGLELAR
ncbi:MAG TPA: EutN/CcmL family microcompartment protein [Polyangia bacterium]|nr:EutN/CcmL family microcompartment protein [Polyangia bacterium]